MHFYHAMHNIGLYNASFTKVTIGLVKRNSVNRGSARLFLNDNKICVLTGNITVYSAHVSNRHSTQTKRDTFVVAVILSLKRVYVCYDLSNERD